MAKMNAAEFQTFVRDALTKLTEKVDGVIRGTEKLSE